LIGSILGVLTSFFFYEAALFSIPFLVYCSSFFIIFIGIGLIIPNTLSQALANHQESLGIAGATFGLLYYILIAIFIALLSAVHTNDSLTLLPLYALLLSIWMFFDFKTSTKVCFK
jgi:drug/metabolite transporter (DMT)-like permease